jgi:uncharacterized protein (DUF58 family)
MRRALATAAAGVMMVLAALVFGTAPLLVAGSGFVLLGALAAAWVWTALRGAHVWRQLASERVVEGEPLEALVTLRRGALALPGAEVRDPLVRGPVGFERLPSPVRGDRAVSVRLVTRFARRGRRLLAPPTLHVRDPLGLAALARAGEGEGDELLVLPRLEPVRWAPGVRGPDREALRDGAGYEPPAAVDVDGLRPYRPGTPASRIHWPAYARGAGLIERRLRADAESRPLVVLDTRGGGALELLDAAVRAAASLTFALARGGGCRLLVSGDARPLAVEHDLRAWPGVHTRLALLQASEQGPVLGDAAAAGWVFYVAARPLRRLPAPLLAGAGGPRALVLPAALFDALGLPAGFEVAGCRGQVVGARVARRVRRAA